MIGVVIVGFLILVFGLAAIAQIGRLVNTIRGHHKCRFCGKGLKGVGLTFATTCHHCGHDQPWAAQAVA
jgi:hypothetical protein